MFLCLHVFVLSGVIIKWFNVFMLVVMILTVWELCALSLDSFTYCILQGCTVKMICNINLSHLDHVASSLLGLEDGGHPSTADFALWKHVSNMVKDWILEMVDWPQGQCKLCCTEWWPQGGEAERKWTWRSDQNIVRQGNKVNWSRPQFLWKLNQWGFC